MQNINRISRARLLSCATVGLVVSISSCLAQGNRDASQEMQRLGTAPPGMMTPFKCDSLDPKVCFDIYRRMLNHESAPPMAAPNWRNWITAQNWITAPNLSDLHYGLGAPNVFGTVPSGAWVSAVEMSRVVVARSIG
jgi:hypothetical protein